MNDASGQRSEAVAADSSRLGKTVAILSLGLGLVVTAAIWSSERRNAELEAQSILLDLANDIAAEVTHRLVAYELALRGAASLFAAVDSPSREQWRTYVEALDLGRSYTSPQGLGYSAWIAPGTVRAVELSMRANGFPDFRVWPSGPRSEVSAVLYVEPLDAGNARALGYDMLSDPVARQAMLSARDTGSPALSGPVTLVQDAGRQTGPPAVLMFMPVYRSKPGVKPADAGPSAQRELLGWVYAPFRPADVVSDVGRGELLAIRMYDDASAGERTLLYADAAARFPAETRMRAPTTQTLSFAGRNWVLEVQPTSAGMDLFDTGRPWEYLAGGIVVSLLLFGIMWSMATTRARANTLALSMTDALWRANQTLDRRVNERTEELTRMNAKLRAEVDEREQAERARGIALEQEARRSAQLRALADAGLGLGLLPDNSLRLEYLADRVCRIVGCAHAIIALATQTSAEPPVMASQQPLAAGERRRILETVRHWPRSPEAVVLENPWQVGGAGTGADGAAVDEGPEVLAVPIGIAQGGEIGMLYLVHVADGRYSEEDRALVRQLTLLAAAAIRNAQLAEEERRARLQAEAASVTKDEFLAIVSHELRTPLHAILGWLGVIERRRGDVGEGGDKLAQALAVIRRNAEAQSMLIDDLLDLARIEQGKLQFDREPVELAQVVAAAVESHRLLALERGVDLQSSLEASGLVLGDNLRLQQATSNLLGNALKFTPAGGRVSVRLRRERGEFVLEVSDTGQGIAQEMLEHIFDRFRQADTSSKRRQGGLGLGLALVRHIVEMHGGSVRAFSEGEGRGSTFVATLPAMTAAAEHGFDTLGRVSVETCGSARELEAAFTAAADGAGGPASGMPASSDPAAGVPGTPAAEAGTPAVAGPVSETLDSETVGSETLDRRTFGRETFDRELLGRERLGAASSARGSESMDRAAGPAGQAAVNDDRASATTHRSSVEVPPSPGGQPRHSQVMIVDDIDDARGALGDLLEAHGYSAIDFGSADAALSWLESHPRAEWPIGVLCDIEMPDRDGFEFIVAVRELEAHVGHEPPLPVVALTAYGGIERRIRAREQGFMAYLIKPVRPERLLRLLESLLG